MTNQSPRFYFRQIPELPDEASFLVFKNTEAQPKAFVEFAGGLYNVYELQELSITDQLLILQEADRYRNAFFDPDFWIL